MKNNLSFNWRTIVVVLIVAGVLGLALSGYLTPLTDRIITPIVSVQSGVSAQVQNVYEFFTIPRDIRVLQEENTELRSQVTELQSEILDLEQRLSEADILYALLGYARSRQNEVSVTAMVIGTDPSPFMHYILVDAGSDDGITYNMPVMTDQGLVGRVQAVTASASRIQLITDPDSLVNGIIVDEDIEGVVTGSVTGDLTFGMVAQDEELEIGQIIQTSGLGGNYPSDIVIGQVLNLDPISSGSFQSASIQPAVDFASLQAVSIVTEFRPSNVAPLEY